MKKMNGFPKNGIQICLELVVFLVMKFYIMMKRKIPMQNVQRVFFKKILAMF